MSKSKPSWLFPQGATEEVLKELQSSVVGLPASYLDLLRLGNGGEVGLSVSPYSLCLDSAEDALAYWKSGTYTIQEAFVFGGGGGGGGELLALDMRQSSSYSVICFDPIDPEGSIEQIAPSFEQFIAMVEGAYPRINKFDTNNKERIYNLLVLKGEALLKGQFLAMHQKIRNGEEYNNFFNAISDQTDTLVAYFINDEISASLPERGPLEILIGEVINNHYNDEHFKRLEYAKSDLKNLFANKTDFIIGSNLLDFKVNTFSVFEKYVGDLYDKLLLSNPRSNKKEKKLIELISNYSESNCEEDKVSILDKIKTISFYVSSAEKIEYVLSKSGIQKEQINETRSFLKLYRSQRNSIHNIGVHRGERQSVTVRNIEIVLDKDKPGYTENHNSAFFACHKLMDIYEIMHTSITGEVVF